MSAIKSQIFTANNIDMLKKLIDTWMADNKTIKIVSQSQSSVPCTYDITKTLINVVILYTEKNKKSSQMLNE